MDEEALAYLGLSSASESNKPCHQSVNKPNTKNLKRALKYLSKFPFTYIVCNSYFAKFSDVISPNEASRLALNNKNNFIRYDYEAYINNDKYLESIDTRPKRKIIRRIDITKIDGLNLKKCQIQVKKLSFEEILKTKISKETKSLIINNMKRKSSINNDCIFISVESCFANSTNQIAENGENSSPSKFFISKNPAKRCRNSSLLPLRSIGNSNVIELIDLTEC
ncbi:unnamed protein product [Brachionus calyciflorus]|uniref:Uncharacterized protein n=1 Tax=Brachionus calyciflorus TaxID=104777 RepID=A0A813QEY1_9BILA|nr:unnamed protein product [Brachionus calyciflorus]